MGSGPVVPLSRGVRWMETFIIIVGGMVLVALSLLANRGASRGDHASAHGLDGGPAWLWPGDYDGDGDGCSGADGGGDGGGGGGDGGD